MNEFFDTEAGRHIAYAKQYLEGALTLDEAQKIKGKILRLPTLALASHGLELMLKACIYLNGSEPDTSGRDGHKVALMWNLRTCEPVRRHALFYASSVLQEERNLNRYEGIPDRNEDDQSLIEKLVQSLGLLHGESGYALRYPSPDREKEAPVTPWLVNTLCRTADHFVRLPEDFKMIGNSKC